MRAGEIIKGILKANKVTVVRLSQMMGERQQYTDLKLRGDMKSSYLAAVCDKLGYELVIQPKSAGKRKEGSYVVTVEKEESKAD